MSTEESGSAKSRKKKRVSLNDTPSSKQIPVSPHEISLAVSLLLLEIATADSFLNKHESIMILNTLSGLFGISPEAAHEVFAEAKNSFRSFRGGSASADLLRAHLDDRAKLVLADVIDDLICSHGQPTDLEIYLRNNFRRLMGFEAVPSTQVG